MVAFDYVISDPMGLHARPVGLMVKAIAPYKAASISLQFGEKTADAKRMFAVMNLQVKQGDTVTVRVEGENEREIADTIRGIFEAEKL